MKFLNKVLLLCLILMISIVLCRVERCSISQKGNANCRAIATYCVIELALLNNECKLLKRMDVLLKSPKSSLVNSIKSISYLSDTYVDTLKERKDEEENIMKGLPLIFNPQKAPGKIKKEDSNNTLKKRSQSVSLMKKGTTQNRKKNEFKMVQNDKIKQYGLSIIEHIKLDTGFSFPNSLTYTNLINTLKENLKNFGKILLNFFKEFQINKNIDYQKILCNIFRVRFENPTQESSCKNHYCVIGISWNLEETNLFINKKNEIIEKETKKEELFNGKPLKLKGLKSNESNLKKEMDSLTDEYNEQKSKNKKEHGEHAIYAFPSLSNTITGRDQGEKDHPYVVFQNGETSEYVSNGVLSKGKWGDCSKNFFIKVGKVRNIYMLKDDLLIN